MENVLKDMGLSHFAQQFRQRGFNLNTFKYIMSKGNDLSKKIIAEDTGLSVDQVHLICQRVEQIYGADFANQPPGQTASMNGQQSAGQAQNQSMYPQSKALTSSYGRSNRIKKLFQIPANKPKKELSQIQRMNLARKTSQQKNQVLENFFKKPSEQLVEAPNGEITNEISQQIQSENHQVVEIKDQMQNQMAVRIDESTMNLGNKLAADLLKNQDLSQESDQQDAAQVNAAVKIDQQQPENILNENNQADGIVQIQDSDHGDDNLKYLDNKASQDYVMDKLNEVKKQQVSNKYSQNNQQLEQDGSSCNDDEAQIQHQYQIKEPAKPDYISSSQCSDQYAPPDEKIQQKEKEESFEEQSNDHSDDGNQNRYNDQNADDQQIDESFDEVDENQQMMEKANQYLRQNSQAIYNENQEECVNNQVESQSEATSQISGGPDQYQNQMNHQQNAQEEGSRDQDEESASSITSSQEQNINDREASQQNLHQSRPTIGIKEPASNSFYRQQNHNSYYKQETAQTKQNVEYSNNKLEELQRQLEELQRQHQFVAQSTDIQNQTVQNNIQPSLNEQTLPQKPIQDSIDSAHDESAGDAGNDQESSDQAIDDEESNHQNQIQQQSNSNVMQVTEKAVSNAEPVPHTSRQVQDQESSSPQASEHSSYTNSENNENQDNVVPHQNQYKNTFAQNEERVEHDDSKSSSESEEQQNKRSSNSEMNDESEQDLPSDSEFNNAAQRKKDCLKMQSMWGAGKQIQVNNLEQIQDEKEISESMCSIESPDQEMEDRGFHESLHRSSQRVDDSYKSMKNSQNTPNNNEIQQNCLNQYQSGLDTQAVGQVINKSQQSFVKNDGYLYPNNQNRSPQKLINQVQKIEELYNQTHLSNTENINSLKTTFNQQQYLQSAPRTIQPTDYLNINEGVDKTNMQCLQNSEIKLNSLNEQDQHFDQQKYSTYDDTKIDQLFQKESKAQPAYQGLEQEPQNQLIAQMINQQNVQNMNDILSNQPSNLNQNVAHSHNSQNMLNNSAIQRKSIGQGLHSSSPFKISLNNQDEQSLENMGLSHKQIQTAIEIPINDKMTYDQYVQINPRDLTAFRDNMTQSMTYLELENNIQQQLHLQIYNQIETNLKPQLTQQIQAQVELDLRNKISQQVIITEREKLYKQAREELYQQIEKEVRTNFDNKYESELENLRQKLYQEKQQELNLFAQKNEQNLKELDQKLKMSEAKQNQFIDMIKKKDKELLEINESEQFSKKLVENLNNKVNEYEDQVKQLTRIKDAQTQQINAESQQFKEQTEMHQITIQNHEQQIKQKIDQIEGQTLKISSLEKQMEEKSVENKILAQKLHIIEQQSLQILNEKRNEEDRLKQKQIEAEEERQRVLEQKKLEEKRLKEQEQLKQKQLQLEQQRKMQMDIDKYQRQLNELLAQQKAQQAAEQQQSKSTVQVDQRVTQEEQMRIDQQEQENKRLKKQIYKEKKQDYEKQKLEMEMKQKQAMAEIQKQQQQLEKNQRELTAMGVQSSSSKNEIQFQSQDYGNTESDDRQMRTIIQKKVEAYKSLEQKKLKYERQNENLQQMVYSSQISNHNNNPNQAEASTKVPSNVSNEKNGPSQLGNGISVINLDDDNEEQMSNINSQSPSKHSRNMSHMKEESSFLPDQIIPAAKNDKKKVVKRVRFHDDENNEVCYPANSKNSIKRQKVDDLEDQENECYNINRQQFMEEQDDDGKQRDKIEDLMVDNIKRQQKYEISQRESIYGNSYNNQHRNFNKKIYFEDRQYKGHQQDSQYEYKEMKKKNKAKNGVNRGHGSSRSQSPVPEMMRGGSGTGTNSWTASATIQSPVQQKKQNHNNYLDNKMEEYVNNLDSGTKKNPILMNMIKKITGQK